MMTPEEIATRESEVADRVAKWNGILDAEMPGHATYFEAGGDPYGMRILVRMDDGGPPVRVYEWTPPWAASDGCGCEAFGIEVEADRDRFEAWAAANPGEFRWLDGVIVRAMRVSAANADRIEGDVEDA